MTGKQQSKSSESKQQKKSQEDAQEQKTAKHEQEGSDKAIAGDAQEPDMSQEVDELIETLDGNLTEIDSEGALGMIDEWYNFLHKAKEPGVKEITACLKELQKLVKSGKASGHEIGEILEQLGEKTNEFASAADNGLKMPLQKLGKQLTHAGAAMGKAEVQEHLEEMNSLIEALDGEDLTSLETEESAPMIDVWYNLVHKEEGEQFQAIASGLKELKQVLKRNNAKPEAIAEVLARLGEQTTEIASEAPRGFKTVVQKLGKQLSKAAKSLASAE